MMKQGFKANRLSTTVNNLFGSHSDLFHKYNNTFLEFAELLLNQWFDMQYCAIHSFGLDWLEDLHTEDFFHRYLPFL